jgi:hypothetical protein
MPNTDNNFNPNYSTIKYIYLLNDKNESILDVMHRNTVCQFERIEFMESISDIFPSGALVVRDTQDIVSYIASNQIFKIKLEYIDASFSIFEITSTAYITNAASATEENYVSIYFTNVYYKYASSTSLNAELLKKDPNWAIPQVYRIHEFIDYINTNILSSVVLDQTASNPVIDSTSNYILYKTLNPKEYRIESPTDNVIQYLNYLASAAISNVVDGGPRFMFWTDFDNKINFKYFAENIENDVYASNATINSQYLRFGVFDGDAVIQKLSDGNQYRKISYLRTDPNIQYVSKNYHYIRKTPKIFDVRPASITPEYYANVLSYQFQDEGEKYNIEVISSKGAANALPGSDEIMNDGHWGYYNELLPVNDGKSLTHLGQDFGTNKSFANLNFMGNTGYFPYIDNPDMWKNMFDMTEVHPHYPDETLLGPDGIEGQLTNLSNIIQIRHKTFKAQVGNTSGNDRLDLIRKIEKQNFVMYVLCCMSKESESFFALLTQYDRDSTTNVDFQKYRGPYRYNWVKLNFNSPYGPTGPSNTLPQNSTGCGGTYYIHQVERWERDPLIKGNNLQDDTWAINLNERAMGISGNGDYLAPGWIGLSFPNNFMWRPIGVTSASFGESGSIQHVVKMHSVPYTDLLSTSRNLVSASDLGKYLYYFTVENVVDGKCVE